MAKELNHESTDKFEYYSGGQRRVIYFFNPFRKSYRRIKADEEKKQKSVRFGILAIIFSFLCVGACYPCVWLGIKGIVFAFTHNLGMFTALLGLGNIVIAALSCGVILFPYWLWLQGIYLVVMQLCLNRRLIGWLALLIWLVSVVGVFLFSLESFLSITGAGHLFE